MRAYLIELFHDIANCGCVLLSSRTLSAIMPVMKSGDKNYALAEDERAQRALSSQDVLKANEWLERYPKGLFSTHSGDPDDPHGTPLAPVVARLMDAGASRLTVHHAYKKLFLGLVVELPADITARKKLFAIDQELSQLCLQRPQRDYGQKYLYYSE